MRPELSSIHRSGSDIFWQSVGCQRDDETICVLSVQNLCESVAEISFCSGVIDRNENAMAIGLLTLELYLPLNTSLKGKRSILKPLIARLRKDFNVSVCEADAQDMHSRGCWKSSASARTARSPIANCKTSPSVLRPGDWMRSLWTITSKCWGDCRP